jgi:hypothetical protein
MSSQIIAKKLLALATPLFLEKEVSGQFRRDDGKGYREAAEALSG